VILSAAGLTTLLSTRELASAAPRALIEATMKTAATGFVSESVAALSQGVLKIMWITKFCSTAMMMLLMGIVGAGAGFLSYRVAASDDTNQPASTPAKDPESRRRQVRVPAQRDGVLLFLATEIKAGEEVPADRVIRIKVGKETKTYRRLKQGDTVEPEQLLGRIDDRLAQDECAIREGKVAIAQAEYLAACKTRDEAEARYNTQQRLMGAGVKVGPAEDLRAAKLLWETKRYEAQAKEKAVEVAKIELAQAKTIVQMHEIRSPVHGVIKSIARYPGESVRNLETVLVIRIAKESD
jgi:hypothetical protein